MLKNKITFVTVNNPINGGVKKTTEKHQGDIMNYFEECKQMQKPKTGTEKYNAS